MDETKVFRFPNGPLIRLVGDRTLFHDMFRKTHEDVDADSARWLLAYLTWRNALNPTDVILVTARSILREVELAFRNIEYQLPRVLAATYSFVRQVDLPDTVPSKHAAIYVAKLLSDQGGVPLLATSVQIDKMVERIHEAGLELQVEGFTERMSELRVKRGAWCIPAGPVPLTYFLSIYDPMYQEIVPSLGIPPVFGHHKHASVAPK